MIKPDDRIEQWIYTGGGTHVAGRDNGNFQVWSASVGLTDREISDEIRKIMSTIANGNTSEYEERHSYVTTDQLREGAKPHGLFKKKYDEDDYVKIKNITRNKITIINETGRGRLTDIAGRGVDFRMNPEQAPYRIAATKLLDGRLMVGRVGAITRIYSDVDSRDGNIFQHVFVFPKGTELSDIDISKLDFKYGLERKYWGTNAEVAPKNLPTTSLGEMYRRKAPQSSTNTQTQQRPQTQPVNNTQTQQRPQTATYTQSQPRPQTQPVNNTQAQQRPQTATYTQAQPRPQTQPVNNTQTQQRPQTQPAKHVLLSDEELLEVAKKYHNEKNPREKISYKTILNIQAKLGADIPKLMSNICEINLNGLKKGTEILNCDSLISELESIFIEISPYYDLFEKMEKIRKLAFEHDRALDKTSQEKIANEMEKLKNDVKKQLNSMDLEVIKKIAKSQTTFITNKYKMEEMIKHKRIPDSILMMPWEEQIRRSAASILYSQTELLLKKQDNQPVVRR